MTSACMVAVLWACASFHALQAQEELKEASEDTVTQMPLAKNVSRGSSLTLRCQLHLRSRHFIEMVSFSWSTADKNYTCIATSSTGGTAGESTQETSQCTEGLKLNISLRRAELTLDNAMEKDAGVYICKVAILRPAPRNDLQGSGSVITITEPLPSPVALPSYLPSTVVAVAGLLVLLIVTILLIIKVKACHRWNCGTDTSGANQIVRNGTIYADIQCAPHVSSDLPVKRELPIIYSELKLSPPENTEQFYQTRD